MRAVQSPPGIVRRDILRSVQLTADLTNSSWNCRLAFCGFYSLSFRFIFTNN